MNFVEATKTVAALSDDLASTGTHAMVVDTLGFSHLSMDVCFEAVAAAGTSSTVALVCKLQSSDTTTASDFADLTATVGGGTGGFTMPTPANTTSDVVVRFDIDLGHAKRYFRTQVTPRTAGGVFSVARLSSKEDANPYDAHTKGVAVAVSALGFN